MFNSQLAVYFTVFISLTVICDASKCAPSCWCPSTVPRVAHCSGVGLMRYPDIILPLEHKADLTLDLRNNHLRFLPLPEYVVQFKTVDIRNNPLICSQQDFFTYIADRVHQNACIHYVNPAINIYAVPSTTFTTPVSSTATVTNETVGNLFNMQLLSIYSVVATNKAITNVIATGVSIILISFVCVMVYYVNTKSQICKWPHCKFLATRRQEEISELREIVSVNGSGNPLNVLENLSALHPSADTTTPPPSPPPPARSSDRLSKQPSKYYGASKINKD